MCHVGWEICLKRWSLFLNLEKTAYICKGAQRAQKANHYQAEDKKFAPVVETVGVFVQHSRDDGLQSTELKTKEKQSLIPCGKSAWKQRKPDLLFGSVPCCPAPAWSSSQRRWWQKKWSPSCLQWLLGKWWRANSVLRTWEYRIQTSGPALMTSHHHFSVHMRPADLCPWQHPPPPPSSSPPCSPARWRWRTLTRSWSNSWPGWSQWRPWRRKKKTHHLSVSFQWTKASVHVTDAPQVQPDDPQSAGFLYAPFFSTSDTSSGQSWFAQSLPITFQSFLAKEIIHDVCLLLFSLLIASAEHTRQGSCSQLFLTTTWYFYLSSTFPFTTALHALHLIRGNSRCCTDHIES